MLLDDQEKRLLSEAKSEVQKHECRAGLADSSILKLNIPVESQRKEIGHTITGYEQGLLHEKLAERERALRETRIRGIHKMEELKRVQKLRDVRFSRRRMIESQQECRICKMNSSV